MKTENGAKENKMKSPKAPKDKKSKLVEKMKTKKDFAKFGEVKTEEVVDKKPLTKVESREKQKKLKEERRKKKDGSVFELSVQAKKVWEEVRREDCPKQKQVFVKFTYTSRSLKQSIYLYTVIKLFWLAYKYSAFFKNIFNV